MHFRASNRSRLTHKPVSEFERGRRALNETTRWCEHHRHGHSRALRRGYRTAAERLKQSMPRAPTCIHVVCRGCAPSGSRWNSMRQDRSRNEPAFGSLVGMKFCRTCCSQDETLARHDTPNLTAPAPAPSQGTSSPDVNQIFTLVSRAYHSGFFKAQVTSRIAPTAAFRREGRCCGPLQHARLRPT